MKVDIIADQIPVCKAHRMVGLDTYARDIFRRSNAFAQIKAS